MVTLTDKAAEAIRSIFAQQGKPDASLRVYVAGGGCSGLQYGMAIEEVAEENDNVFESHGIRILVDEISHPYIDGSEVDFEENLMGGGFRVNNPNAVRSCGCGHSFQAEDGPGGGGCCG
jgi:iron-sulfur cluster assembly protein